MAVGCSGWPWDAPHGLVGDSSKPCTTSLQHHAGAFRLGFYFPLYFFFLLPF